MTSGNILFSREIVAAHGLHQPIVVLETTVIAQGLPWPTNLETGRLMEAEVRDAGAMPATIGILDGVARIGLSLAEIERFAASAAGSDDTEPREMECSSSGSPPRRFMKANRRDLAVAMTSGRCAATTVSATLWLARRAGLGPCVMATGGLGGVHRQAAETFDVSTDLDELYRSDGALVVSSGFKSILDIPATLESLETRGIMVVGYRTSDLPAFTTLASGLPLEHRVETPEQAAALVQTHRRLGLPGAIVLANPVPESDALDRDLMETALDSALQNARSRGISGKAMTPFLLDAISRATLGQSLRANQALLVRNARIAAEVAVAIRQGEISTRAVPSGLPEP